MAKRIKIKAGDVFRIKVAGNNYVFGRVLLEVTSQCKGKVPEDSNLNFFGGCILVEMYNLFTKENKFDNSNAKVLIPGMFTDRFGIIDGIWEIIDHIPVIPELVEFPESLLSFSRKIYFSKGELILKTKLSTETYEEMCVYSTKDSAYAVGSICLHYLGKDDLIDEQFKWPQYLENSDFRYQPELRAKIIKQAGYDASKSYYENALERGFDLKRFYE